MSKRIPYTDEDINHWLEMYNDGKTQEEIALEVRVSQATVVRRLGECSDYVPRPVGSPHGVKQHNAIEARIPGSRIPKAQLNPTDGRRRRGRL